MDRRETWLSHEHARIQSDRGFISTRPLNAEDTIAAARWVLDRCLASQWGEEGVRLRSNMFDVIDVAQQSLDQGHHWEPGPLRMILADRDERMLFKLTWC